MVGDVFVGFFFLSLLLVLLMVFGIFVVKGEQKVQVHITR